MAEQTLEHETDETDNTSWVDVFNSIDQLLQTINEKQDDGNIAFHEASLILNKLETALSIAGCIKKTQPRNFPRNRHCFEDKRF